MGPGRGFFFNDREDKVHFILFEQLFQLRGIAFPQGEFQAGKFLSDGMENFRQMIAKNDRGGADANLPGLAALEIGGYFVQVGKKGLDELKEPFAFRSEREGPALEQGRAQIFLKLGNLRTNGGLLDSVGDVAHGRHDAAVSRNVIKKFKMMDIH